MANYKQSDEMSMEDILSSIRKYVADEKHTDTLETSENSERADQPNDEYNTSDSNFEDNVITLGQEDVADHSVTAKRASDDDIVLGASTTDTNYNNLSPEENPASSYSRAVEGNGGSPFNKLAEALKTYNSRKKNIELNLKMSMEQFYRTVTENYLQKWMDANLKKTVDEMVRKEIEKLKQE